MNECAERGSEALLGIWELFALIYPKRGTFAQTSTYRMPASIQMVQHRTYDHSPEVLSQSEDAPESRDRRDQLKLL